MNTTPLPPATAVKIKSGTHKDRLGVILGKPDAYGLYDVQLTTFVQARGPELKPAVKSFTRGQLLTSQEQAA